MKAKQKKVLFTIGSFMIGAATKSLASFAWKKIRGNHPPKNPAQSEVNMGEALSWAITLAVVTGIVRTIYRKKVSEKFAIEA